MRPRTKQWQENFLKALRLMGNVWRACRYAKVSRRTPYACYKHDAEFAKAWQEAEEESADRLEAEAWRRAHDGIPKPITVAGERVDVLEYSDALLTLLLKARRPQKFRENYNIAVGNPDGSKLELDSRQQAINLFSTNPEAAAHMIALSNMMLPQGANMTEKSEGGGNPEATSQAVSKAESTPATFDATQDCAPGNLAHAQNPPVGKKSAPKASKRRKPKKAAVAPIAHVEDEIPDESEAKPMTSPVPTPPKAEAWRAFLPKDE